MGMTYSGFDRTLTYFWDQHNKGVSQRFMSFVVGNVLTFHSGNGRIYGISTWKARSENGEMARWQDGEMERWT